MGEYADLHRSLQRAKESGLKEDPIAQHHEWTTLGYKPVTGDYPPNVVQFFQTLLANGGASASSLPDREVLVKAVSEEFGCHCMRAESMAMLIQDLEELNRCKLLPDAVRTMTFIVEKILFCHKAYFWEAKQVN